MPQAPSRQRPEGAPVAADPGRGASPVQRSAATGYDWIFDHVDPWAAPTTAAAWSSRPTGLVLEIGAGTGHNLPGTAPPPGSWPWSPPSGDARQSHPGRPRAPVPVEILDGTAEDLLFPDASFDTVIAGLVLCAVPDLAGALEEARRVLCPGREVAVLRARPGAGPALGPLAGPGGASLGVAGRRLPPQPRRRGGHHRRRVPRAGAGPVRLPGHAAAGRSHVLGAAERPTYPDQLPLSVKRGESTLEGVRHRATRSRPPHPSLPARGRPSCRRPGSLRCRGRLASGWPKPAALLTGWRPPPATPDGNAAGGDRA